MTYAYTLFAFDTPLDELRDGERRQRALTAGERMLEHRGPDRRGPNS